jgi:hypothetical protein
LNVFTGFLVAVGALQFWSLYVGQRAFLHLESATLGTLIPGKLVTVTGGIKNSGKSTAFIIDSNTSWTFNSRNLAMADAPQYTPGSAIPPTGPFVPDETIEQFWNAEHSEQYANADLISKIKSGDVVIYLYGYVTYTDAFKVFSHTTRFCAKYDALDPPPDNRLGRCGLKNYETAD